MIFRQLLCAASLALVAATPAHAVTYRLDFTGTITNSLDQGGAVFGAAASGGQNGLAISGSLLFDPAGYADQAPGDPYLGSYGPTNGLFPQPLDLFASSYLIDGQSFLPSMNMGVPSGHSLEQAALRNPVPTNFVQQDVIDITDGSQALYCSNPTVPASCTGGAQGTDQLHLKLFGIIDIIANDELGQVLSFTSIDIANILAAPAGGQANSYLHQRANDANTAWIYNMSGEFNLTSLSLGPVADTEPLDAPEPAPLAALALGIAALAWLRRRGPALRRA